MIPGDGISRLDGQTGGQECTVKEIDDMVGGLPQAVPLQSNSMVIRKTLILIGLSLIRGIPVV